MLLSKGHGDFISNSKFSAAKNVEPLQHLFLKPTREWMVPNPQKTEKQNYPRAQAWQAWQWELLDFREVHIAGWWFGTFFIFPFSGEFHHPNWLIFFRGVGLNHQPDSHVAQYALKCTDHCVRNGPSKVFLIVVLCSVTWRDVAVAGRVTPKEW